MSSIHYINWSNNFETQNLLAQFLQASNTLNFQSRLLLQ